MQSQEATCCNRTTMQSDRLMGEPYCLAILGAIATWPNT
jgi:hypothetical protein